MATCPFQTNRSCAMKNNLFCLLILFLGSGFAIGAVVEDGGFETGPFGGFWSESSTNFGPTLSCVGTTLNATMTGQQSS